MRIAILAGGRGTRLKPITDNIPKVLVPIIGVPFLKILLASLPESEIFLLTGYKSRMISRFCAKYKDRIGNVKIIKESKPLGTGGALSYFAAGQSPLFVMNGDTYVGVPFEKMLAFHKKKKADITILAHTGDLAGRGAIIHDKSGKVKAFSEKISAANGSFSTGVYIINPNVIRRLLKKLHSKFSMETDGFPLIVKEGRIYTYVSSGTFFDIGTHESLDKVRGI